MVGPAVDRGAPQDLFRFGADGQDLARFADLFRIGQPDAVDPIGIQDAAVAGRTDIIQKRADFDRADQVVARDVDDRNVA